MQPPLENDHQELRRQLAFYRQLIDSSNGWEYLCDPLGNCLYVSPAAEQLSGYAPEAFYQNHALMESLIHPEDLGAYKQAMLQLGHAHPSASIAYRITTKAGQLEWVQHTCHLQFSPSGEPQGLRGSLTRITDHKSKEQDLIDREETMAALMNVTGESAILTDADGRFMAMNDRAAERLGRPKEALIGQIAFDIFPPDLAQSRKAYMKELMKERGLIVFYDEREGIIYENRVYPILDENQELYRIAIYAKDVTQRKQAERKLAESEERFSAIASQMQEGIVLIDRHGNYTYANPAFCQMSGYSQEEILESVLFDLKANPSDPCVAFEETIQHGQSDNRGVPLRRKDGTVYEAWVRGQQITIGGEIHMLALVSDITRELAAEREVKQAQAKLSVFIESSPARMLFVGFREPMPLSLDAEGRYEWIKQHSFIENCNETLLQQYGLTSKALLVGRSTFDFVKRDELLFKQLVAEYSQQDFRVSNRESTEFNLKGETLYFVNNTTPIILDGHLHAVGITSANITEQKRLENELKESQSTLLSYKERLEQTLTGTASGTFTHDFQTGYLHFDAVAVETLGLEKADMLYEDFYDYVHPDERDPVYRGIMEQFARVEPYITNDYQLRPKGDTIKHVEFKAFVAYKGEKPFRTYGIISDITTQKRLEADLREAKEQLEHFMETSPASIIVIGFSKPMPMSLSHAERFEWLKQYEYIKDCNPAAAHELGYAHKQEIIGMSSYERYDHEDAVMHAVVDPAIEADFSYSNQITEERNEKGETLYFLSVNQPIIIAEQLHEMNIVRINVTKEVELEQNLQKALAAREKLLSVISHDLRAPLASITTSVDVLVDSVERGDMAFVRQIAPLLKDTTVHTTTLLDNLLMWARSQRDAIIFEPRYQSIREIMLEASALPQKAAADKEVQLIIELSSDIHAYVDRQMIHTIIRNLLSNAIKFTPEKGTVTLSSQADGDQLLLTVSDTGIGMSEKQVQNLFQLEYASSKLGTKGEQGTGLGLLLCHEFVLKHQGRITVDSRLGEGTTFTVSLPLRDESDA